MIFPEPGGPTSQHSIEVQDTLEQEDVIYFFATTQFFFLFFFLFCLLSLLLLLLTTLTLIWPTYQLHSYTSLEVLFSKGLDISRQVKNLEKRVTDKKATKVLSL